MFCKHVYETVGSPICPICSNPTHETDWAEQARLQAEWKENNPDAQYGGWWSI